MKKIILSICAAFCALSMSAQLVSSHSTLKQTTVAPKAPRKTTWMFRVGVGSNNVVGDSYDGTSSHVGYFVGFEFNKTIRHRGAYWGMDFALASRGYTYEFDEWGVDVENKLTAHTLHWSPFIFGWKIGIANSKFAIDPHIGFYMAGDYTGKYKYSVDGENQDDVKIYDSEGDYLGFDAGLKIGVGCWYNNKFNVDLTYQRGFIAPEGTDYDGGPSNFWFRLGYAF